MTDDLLSRATRALREETAPHTVDSGVPDEAVARLERSLRGSRTASRARARWLAWPLAAALVMLTAWAGASGRLARLVALATNEEAEVPAGPVLSVSSAPPAPPAPPAPSPSLVLLPLPEAEPEPSVARPAPRPAAVDVDKLYRDAHDAHFVQRDPQAALALWDRYLAAAGPNGKFVLEARYNRALSLVRLGRKPEARAALEPFANGEYGGYRREEATQLLATLE